MSLPAHSHTTPRPPRPRNKLRAVWREMIRRCTNPKSTAWHHYGGRGIYVCDRWMDSFEAFLKDMGYPPPGHSIDRIDNDGPYHPDNCRWATQSEQVQNQHNYQRAKTHCPQGHPYDDANTYVTRNGKRACIACSRQRTKEWRAARAKEKVAAPNHQSSKTHCPQGHPYDDKNTYVYREGTRACIACKVQRTREWRAARAKERAVQ